MSSVISTASPSNKLLYIDNIKLLLTILVVLHHTCVTYGGPGGWYYIEKTTHLGALIPMTMFVSINQSYFMGFFFMLAAYFTGTSYARKGASKFIGDRLFRLGIPLVFYSFVFSPLLCYLVYYFGKEQHITYWQYLQGYDNWIDFGVMWFVVALLLSSLVYAFIKSLFNVNIKNPLPTPTAYTILLLATAVGFVSFLVRIIFPVGWVLKPLGFQLGHFPQYIVFFIIGLLAARNNWFDQLSERTRKQLTLSIGLCLLFFPMFYLIRVKLDMPIAWYSGGFHWQSLLYAVWEQLIGISLLTVLLIYGKKHWNTTSVLLSKLSRCSFAVYIFHPLVIIGLSLAVRNWTVDPSIKLLVIAPIAVLGSFVLGWLILLIPGVKKVI